MTTIRLSKETKRMLDNFRVHKRETYDDILVRLMQDIPNDTDELEELEKEVLDAN